MPTDLPDLKPRLDFAVSSARAAAAHILRYYRQDDLAVERKADRTPVTIADREAEQLLREKILAAFPGDGVLGEEFGETAGTSGFRWILDPIDGTKSFVHGVPLFGTLIGVEFGGRSVVGVIGLPALDELVYGAVGLGAWQVRGDGEPRPARVSKTPTLAEGLFCTTTVSGFEKRNRRDAYEKLRAAAGLSRGWGDCYGYALVATGRAEAMVDPHMNLWDTAALQPILEEAGGTLTDWQGVATIYAPEAVATNGLVLAETLALLRP